MGSVTGQSEGDNLGKLVIQFDDLGRPIGKNSAAFSTCLGQFSRAHAPISCSRWKDVPIDGKKMIWTRICEIYDVSGTSKKFVLQRANEYWRKYKSSLRKFYDLYNTDEQRKENCPTGVKQDEWEGFVNNEADDKAKARRVKGKQSQKAAAARQRSGRKGSARLVFEMVEKDPNTPVTRTRRYLALHTKSDGTCPTQGHSTIVDNIQEIVNNDPSSTFLDLDDDPVAQVYGKDCDRNGHVRGWGNGVSKRGLETSAPARNQLKRQKEITSALGDVVSSLKVTVQKHDQYFANMRSGEGSTRHFGPDFGASDTMDSNVRPPAGFPSPLRERACKLYSMRREHVANGRAIIGDSPREEVFYTYDVLLDRVFMPNTTSTNKETLGEEDIGSLIEWPKALTVLA